MMRRNNYLIRLQRDLETLEFSPEKLSLATITKVLQNILDESVSVRDMRTILEVLSTEVHERRM